MLVCWQYLLLNIKNLEVTLISRKDLLDFIASTDAEQFYIDEGGLNLMADNDTYLEIGGDPNYGMKYKIGDKVRIVSTGLTGVICRVDYSGEEYRVVFNDGFTFSWYSEHQLEEVK
jgi:hypothetical protein